MSHLVMTAAEVADVLRMSEKTFRNKKPQLDKIGFPQPINFPGVMRWLYCDIEAWLRSRSQPQAQADLPQSGMPASRLDDPVEIVVAPVPEKRKPGRPPKISPEKRRPGRPRKTA